MLLLKQRNRDRDGVKKQYKGTYTSKGNSGNVQLFAYNSVCDAEVGSLWYSLLVIGETTP